PAAARSCSSRRSKCTDPARPGRVSYAVSSTGSAVRTVVFRRLPHLLLLLHPYVGVRLLPDLLGAYPLAFAATATWLVASAIATPLWPLARGLERQPLRDRLILVSMVAIGAFASL